jgi:hypothetical protein
MRRRGAVGEVFGAVAGIAGERVSEALEVGVDVLAAAFDEAVGVEHEGIAGSEGQVGLGAGDVFGAGASGGSLP